MRNVLTISLGILAGAGLGLAAHAVTPTPSLEQFQGIPERNVFGLKSGQPEPENTAPKTPPTKLTLTGITTLLGNKLVLLRAALPGAPGVPAQEKPLMLSEGQRDGNIEVLEINEKAGSVRVNDGGQILTLTFAKNGVKPPTSAAAPAAGTAPSTAPASLSYPGLNTRMRVMPTRLPRTPATGATPETGAVGTPGVAPAAGAATAPATTPSAADTALTPTGPVPTPNPATNQTQLSPEAQVLLQALEQEANNANANPPPPPPSSTIIRTPSSAMPAGANLQRAHPPLMPQ